MESELWTVSIPVEGYTPKEDEYTWCDEVIFHGHIDSDQGRRFLGSIVLKGERDLLKEKAVELIDKALTKLILLLQWN